MVMRNQQSSGSSEGLVEISGPLGLPQSHLTFPTWCESLRVIEAVDSLAERNICD
jgi:hypothetical protein